VGSFNDVMRATQRRRYETASPYDFRQVEKFSADQTRFLEKLFVSFAESVVTLLAPLLQTRFQMEMVSIKPRSYHSYLNSLPDPTPILVFRLDSDAMGFLDIDFDLSFALFDKLMGGKGVAPRDEVRPFFTDLEKAILQKPLLKMLEGYSEAWQEVKEVRPQYVSLEFNPMAVHIAPPSETMVITSFQADVAHAQGLVNVCIPFRYLKNTIPRSSFDEFVLTKTGSGATQAQAQVVAPIFAKNLESARVPVSISLGRAEILFQDLLTIEVGDTIRLDTEIAAPLKIKVNEKSKFLGLPGLKDGRLAAKVVRVLQEGDEEFDE
ncbi:MAG: FliM/FliN family flagellar motor switch protein, partial [Candidatus Eremiobacterota bacterium]